MNVTNIGHFTSELNQRAKLFCVTKLATDPFSACCWPVSGGSTSPRTGLKWTCEWCVCFWRSFLSVLTEWNWKGQIAKKHSALQRWWSANTLLLTFSWWLFEKRQKLAFVFAVNDAECASSKRNERSISQTQRIAKVSEQEASNLQHQAAAEIAYFS